MIISRELMLGIQPLRITWFSLRVLYLKALINILRLIGRLENKFLVRRGGTAC
jgi:hypothetical protein